MREGDRFRPLGAPGVMLLSDFFTNRKVARTKRAAAIVVEDAEGIIWLWPYRIAHRARLREDTSAAIRFSLLLEDI